MTRIHSAYWYQRRSAIRKLAPEICQLMTMTLESRLQTLDERSDSDRKFARDLIVEELTGYYGGPTVPDDKRNSQISFIEYNPECFYCCRRLGLSALPKTGLWNWIKEKLGWH